MSTQAPTQPLTRDEVIVQLRHGVEPSEITKLTDITVATIRTIKTRLKDEIIEQLQKKLEVLQEDYEVCNQGLQDYQEEERARMVKNLEEGDKHKKALQRITALEKSITEKDINIEGLNEVIELHHKESVNYHKEIENSNNFITDRNTEIVRLKELVTKLENDVKDRDIDITYSKELITQYEEDITRYLKRITDLENNLKVRQKWQNWTYYVLPFAILLLHVSSVWGVGNVLSMLFHTPIMGYSTALVICTTPLVIMLSRLVTKELSITIMLFTLVIEMWCNVITITAKNDTATWNVINQAGVTPYYTFLFLSVIIPLLNLALEILFFNNQNKSSYE